MYWSKLATTTNCAVSSTLVVPRHFCPVVQILSEIEREMYNLCDEALPLNFVKLSFEDALEYFRERQQTHTLALLKAKDKNALTVPCVECDGNFMVVRNAPTVTNTRMLSPTYLGRKNPFRLIPVPGHDDDQSFSIWFSHNGIVSVSCCRLPEDSTPTCVLISYIAWRATDWRPGRPRRVRRQAYYPPDL